MSILNALLRGLFDHLLYPFHLLPPVVGLAFVSLLVAVGMLLVFKATSNQTRIGEVKRHIHACLFEIRLFNDDLRAILRAQLEILRHNLTYLRLSAVPMLWMLPPLFLVVAQLQFQYGYQGLKAGQQGLVKVELGSAWEGAETSRPPASLDVPPGLRVETPALWIPRQKELAWRIAAEREGAYDLSIRLGGQTYTKSVNVSAAVTRRSPIRLEKGFVNQLLYPAEDPLPKGGPIKSISLTYPDSDVLGWGLHWMVVFFVLSMLFAFALKNRFGVTL